MGPHSRSRSEAIYELVVFDLDGTLVDSAADLADAVNAALSGNELPRVPDEQVVGFIGNGTRLLVSRSIEVHRPAPSVDLVDAVLEDFRGHYAHHCLDKTVLYPGVLEMLEALREAGVSLAVLTNKQREFSEQILQGLQVRSFFSSIVGGDDFPSRKPDPTGLRSILDALSCPAEACVMVGDSTVDLATASNAGVSGCAVTWGFVSEAKLLAASPRFLASTPAEVSHLLLARAM